MAQSACFGCHRALCKLFGLLLKINSYVVESMAGTGELLEVFTTLKNEGDSHMETSRAVAINQDNNTALLAPV